MLTLQRLTKEALSSQVHKYIREACMELELTLESPVLCSAFSGRAAALNVILSVCNSYTFILYDDGEPVGGMSFNKVYVPYMDCACVQEEFLFIRPEYRNYRTLMYLVRNATLQLREYFPDDTLVFAGNLLGIHRVESAYKRAGFTRVGSHLVTKLGDIHGFHSRSIKEERVR